MGDAAHLQANVRDADPEPFCAPLPDTQIPMGPGPSHPCKQPEVFASKLLPTSWWEAKRRSRQRPAEGRSCVAGGGYNPLL